MATNWITLVPEDLVKVITIEVYRKSNQNVDADTVDAALSSSQPPKNYDENLPDRAAAQLAFAVNQIRAAIQLAAKQPLSLTAGSVPPGSEKHVLYIAAYGLVNSTPELQMVVLAEGGAVSPFKTNFEKAAAYLEAVTKGRLVVPPTDPTGRDYTNPINIPWCGSGVSPFPPYDSTKPFNPPVSAVRVGASSPPVDMNTGNSIFNRLAFEGEFPVDNLGQP